jgi:hypothetical protein
MSLRILPFRQYAEEDVVNLYRVADGAELDSTTGTGTGDAGVFVKVAGGDFSLDPVSYSTDNYLGKTDYPHVGRAQYPKVNLTVEAATTGAAVLGITLLQTAKADENGEKLLYNPQKALELQAALPGQAVPVATKGVFTLADTAVDGTLTPGAKFSISANAGKITGCAVDSAYALGTVLGSGSRTTQNGTADQFDGSYYVIKLG